MFTLQFRYKYTVFWRKIIGKYGFSSLHVLLLNFIAQSLHVPRLSETACDKGFQSGTFKNPGNVEALVKRESSETGKSGTVEAECFFKKLVRISFSRCALHKKNLRPGFLKCRPEIDKTQAYEYLYAGL